MDNAVMYSFYPPPSMESYHFVPKSNYKGLSLDIKYSLSNSCVLPTLSPSFVLKGDIVEIHIWYYVRKCDNFSCLGHPKIVCEFIQEQRRTSGLSLRNICFFFLMPHKNLWDIILKQEGQSFLQLLQGITEGQGYVTEHLTTCNSSILLLLHL